MLQSILSGHKCFHLHHNAVLPASWYQLVTTHFCHVTVSVRFALALPWFDISCFLTPYGPVFIEPVLLLELTSLFYCLQNCLITFRTNSRNCWNAAWCRFVVCTLPTGSFVLDATLWWGVISSPRLTGICNNVLYISVTLLMQTCSCSWQKNIWMSVKTCLHIRSKQMELP
jgi:hypothetical protein